MIFIYNLLEEIEKIAYRDHDLRESSYWKEKLQGAFGDYYIDDLTDLNYSTCFTYLLSLSETEYSLFSKEVDRILESRDLYFLEVLISTEKPLASFHFWKYLKKEDGIDRGFTVSDKGYLKEDDRVYRRMMDFIHSNNLIFLDNRDLRTEMIFKGRPVNIYYRYFNQEGKPLDLPY